MGSLFKQPKPDPVPVPKVIEKPVEMPDPESPERRIDEKRRLARAIRSSGRRAASLMKRSKFG